MANAIIFDWGRTLYDPEIKTVFPGVPELLARLKQKYQLAIVCLATDGDFNRRKKAMSEAGIENLFSCILMAEKDKDRLYEQALEQLGCEAKDVVIVDDRVIRGIRSGNQNGVATVWLKRGKFAQELPNHETGEPYNTISHITELSYLI